MSANQISALILVVIFGFGTIFDVEWLLTAGALMTCCFIISKTGEAVFRLSGGRTRSGGYRSGCD